MPYGGFRRRSYRGFDDSATISYDAKMRACVLTMGFNRFVNDGIKMLPYESQYWDAANKRRLFDFNVLQPVEQILERAGVTIERDDLPASVPHELVGCVADVRYVGGIRNKGDSKFASGDVRGEWRVLFKPDALLRWFNATLSSTTEYGTLYATLGVARTATEDEIKKAYRRASKQWHPDLCKEPNATQMFQSINQAYEQLKDPDTRSRYDGALLLAASVPTDENGYAKADWHPPLRCGRIKFQGEMRVGRWIVERIDQWDDITNAQGQTLVTSWDPAEKAVKEVWA